MLTEEQIRQSLHARRVIPLGVANPHGPFGLEQLAAAVSHHAPNRATDGSAPYPPFHRAES